MKAFLGSSRGRLTTGGSLVAAVLVSMLAAAPLANARSGGGMSPGMAGRSGDGRFNSWHGRDGGHFDHDRFHNHVGFFFFGPGPFSYPYYWPPYYYYDYYDYRPPYDYYYDNSPANYYSDNTPGYPQYDGRTYLMLGHDAGKALKSKTASRDWLVEYLRAYIINAPASARDDFRRGFISGYGENAESVFQKAMQDAGQQNPPPPPPPSNHDGPQGDQPRTN